MSSPETQELVTGAIRKLTCITLLLAPVSVCFAVDSHLVYLFSCFVERSSAMGTEAETTRGNDDMENTMDDVSELGRDEKQVHVTNKL